MNGAIGPYSGASNTGQASSGSGTYVFYEPNGGERVIHQVEHQTTSYVGGTVPASIGYTTLLSPMTIVPGETKGASPTIGTPTWSCTAPRSAAADQIAGGGLEPSGALLYFRPASLGEFSTSQHSDCSSVIALADAGEQSKQNLLLLLIGAALSAGIGLIIEVAIRQPRKRKTQPAPASDAAATDERNPPGEMNTRRHVSH